MIKLKSKLLRGILLSWMLLFVIVSCLYFYVSGRVRGLVLRNFPEIERLDLEWAMLARESGFRMEFAVFVIVNGKRERFDAAWHLYRNGEYDAVWFDPKVISDLR